MKRLRRGMIIDVRFNPVDHRVRMVRQRGRVSDAELSAIDQALRTVFDL